MSIKEYIDAKAIKAPIVTIVRKNGFYDFARFIGKIGGQYKMVRLSVNEERLMRFKTFLNEN
jgi:hypothetical protein